MNSIEDRLAEVEDALIRNESTARQVAAIGEQAPELWDAVTESLKELFDMRRALLAEQESLWDLLDAYYEELAAESKLRPPPAHWLEEEL